MQLFERPSPPDDFEAAVSYYRTKTKNFFMPDEAGEPEEPEEPEGGGGEKKYEFSPKWKEYKPHFARAQHGKCGYCEIMVIGGQLGDVEHYLPKGEVWMLKDDPETWGREHEWESRVEGREHELFCKRGYWWKAYDWSNYLLSCMVCNQYWKLSFLPVGDKPRANPPAEGVAETPLLLNPFDASRPPSRHLRFNDLGHIEAKDDSPFGWETIRTCGLDRESLRRSRKEKAQRAYKLAQDLSRAADEEERAVLLRDFHELGKVQYIHSGMVRTIFEELCGMTWEELEELLA